MHDGFNEIRHIPNSVVDFREPLPRTHVVIDIPLMYVRRLIYFPCGTP